MQVSDNPIILFKKELNLNLKSLHGISKMFVSIELFVFVGDMNC